MMPEWFWVTFFIFLAVGCITDFYGLGSLWANRGNWYVVQADELSTVMSNLRRMRAFDDSDGLSREAVKVKAYCTAFKDTVYYSVKVPDWVFKYERAQLNEATKLKMLGLTE